MPTLTEDAATILDSRIAQAAYFDAARRLATAVRNAPDCDRLVIVDAAHYESLLARCAERGYDGQPSQ